MPSIDDVASLLNQLVDDLQSLLPVAGQLGVNPSALKGFLQQARDLCVSVAAVSTPDSLITFSGSTLPIFTAWQVVTDAGGKVVSGTITMDISKLPTQPGVIQFTDVPQWVS